MEHSSPMLIYLQNLLFPMYIDPMKYLKMKKLHKLTILQTSSYSCQGYIYE